MLTEEVGGRARRRGHGRVEMKTDVKRPHSVSYLLPPSNLFPVSYPCSARAAPLRLPQTPMAFLLAYRCFDSPAGQHKCALNMCVNSPNVNHAD